MYPGASAEYTYPQFQNSQEFAFDYGVILDILANNNKTYADGVINMSMAFEMKTFHLWKEAISKSDDSQFVPKCEFWKWGYNCSKWHPVCTVEHFVNMFTV